MRKKKRIWIFAVVFAMAAVQGTAFAGTQNVDSSVEAITETEHAEQISAKDRDDTDIKKISMKQVQKSVKKTADGQTLLDVSQGNITITSAGATGGGYKQ
ncbi:hypothetical protein [Anaerostipes caccae]|uniref:hypothetical protein n=1 Tax=Anaerostipes caccae TaxID=105841 RepID=UPI0038D400FA